MSYHMKNACPAERDWFQIEVHHDDDEKKVYIQRVIFWVFVEEEQVNEHLDAICDEGFPRIAMGNNHIAYTDCYFVNGRDKCPSGETWLEVYDKTLPNQFNIRDITVLFFNWA